eukprot:538895-Pelagomonas_calceolata.AAC.6
MASQLGSCDWRAGVVRAARPAYYAERDLRMSPVLLSCLCCSKQLKMKRMFLFYAPKRLHWDLTFSQETKGACNQNSPSWRTGAKHHAVSQSQHFRHADTNLAYPGTSAWFMKSLDVMHCFWVQNYTGAGTECAVCQSHLSQVLSSYGHQLFFHDAVGFPLEGQD